MKKKSVKKVSASKKKKAVKKNVPFTVKILSLYENEPKERPTCYLD